MFGDELLQLSIIIIVKDNYLTIATATSKSIGRPIHFENKNYYICAPTRPNNSKEIGNAPVSYRNRPFEILQTHQV